jgi:hypothetical protein
MKPGQAKPPGAQAFSPVVPKTWDDAALASIDVPLADPSRTPVHVSSEYYYRIPTQPIYKTYPIYAPGREPPEYMEWLERQEPEIIFDASRLKTEADWIKAGEIVFDQLVFVGGSFVYDVRDPKWYEQTHMPLANDGTMPFFRYVIRMKGKVEVGTFSCGTCHTRVMPDGTVVKGAQGSFPDSQTTAILLRKLAAGSGQQRKTLARIREFEHLAWTTPWLKPDPHERVDQMSAEELAAALEAIPPGVIPRFHSSLFFPPVVPDLIGVKDRRYLDRTGLIQHRSIGDLMRYAALVQGGERLDRFGDFKLRDPLPDPATLIRYSDEQLYALALWLYSLKPPPNPHEFDALAARGQKVFEREACVMCHTPPVYTNNKLTPAEGFTPPPGADQKYDILPISVGTDPGLALKTRKGTGYYKVPSLKGVWYRGPFEHNGSVAMLEDWFDPRRLRDDYVPTGFKGYGVTHRAVPGHPFGLDLSTEDKKALIAFLKTL